MARKNRILKSFSPGKMLLMLCIFSSALSSTQQHKEIDSKPENLLDKEIDKIHKQSKYSRQKVNSQFYEEIQKTYVSPKGTFNSVSVDSNVKKVDVEKYVLEQFLSNDNKTNVLLVVGQGGSGKSTFLQMLEETLWKECKNFSHDWVPIYIPLSCVEKSDKGLIDYIKNKILIEEKTFESLQKDRKILLILDGYDELSKDMLEVGLYKYGNNKSLYKSKIIVSSRPSVIQSTEDEEKIFYDSKSMKKVYLSPYGESEIRQYLNKFLHHFADRFQIHANVDWYVDEIKKLPFLSTPSRLSVTPITLRLLAEVLPALVKNSPQTNSKITETQLFETALNSWFERAWNKTCFNQSSPFLGRTHAMQRYWHYAMHLANEMDKKDMSSFILSSLQENKPSGDLLIWDEVFSKKMGYTDREKKFVFQALPLYKIRSYGDNLDNKNMNDKKLNNGQYQFWHLKVQDFFKTKRALEYVYPDSDTDESSDLQESSEEEEEEIEQIVEEEEIKDIN